MSEKLSFNTSNLQLGPNSSNSTAGELDAHLPEVSVVPYEGPEVRNHGFAQGYSIQDADGEPVGTFNLVGRPEGESRWVNNVQITPERRGERLAVAAYAGVIAVLGAEGTRLISDPQGLSDASVRVWQSLSKRGLASATQDTDVHGYSRFTS
ncbi:MAG: hypothetical protein NVS1B7_1840 [Candidatus Saccharimonadales bacterium]